MPDLPAVPLRYAVGLPNIGEYGDPRTLLGLALDAEASGWDGFFVWDHLLSDPPDWPLADPLVVMAAVATATTRMRLGVLVTALARRRPAKVAREIASLDVLSGGRLVFGAGLGAHAGEWEAFAEDPDPRVRARKLDEGLTVLDGLWSGERFSYAGEHVTVRDVLMRPTPAQRPRVPVWVGGRWPHRAPFRRGARWDGIMPTHVDYPPGTTMPPAELAAAIAFVAASRRSPVVGTPGYDIVVEGATDGRDPAAAADAVRPYRRAGITWWVEALGWWRGPLAAVRARVRQGPPPQPDAPPPGRT